MSAVLQVEQEIQNELTTSNQLIMLIYKEIQQIKQFTKPGGEFEENIKKNTAINAALANIQRIDLDKLPPINRVLNRQHDTSQENSNMNSLP